MWKLKDTPEIERPVVIKNKTKKVKASPSARVARKRKRK
jgi:hypothetical protein